METNKYIIKINAQVVQNLTCAFYHSPEGMLKCDENQLTKVNNYSIIVLSPNINSKEVSINHEATA